MAAHQLAGTTPIIFYDPTRHPRYATDAPALDQYGRRIDYLRVSLTDRCNMRCIYCMPAVGVQFAPRPELLTNDELLLVINAAARAGFRKLRLTGGEPTLRHDLVNLVRELKRIPGIEHIAMTTNALRLRKLAQPLRDAGLDRVNISIDTLDPVKFRIITRGGSLDEVWAGIEAADAAGLHPIKLNAVVVRGMNDEEVVRLAGLTLERPWEFRFIEVMPLTGVAGLAEEGIVASAELIARLEQHYGPLEEIGHAPSDPARTYRIPGAKGVIGFISSVSDPFCATCNRMRLTADGRLHLCLLRDDEVDLRAAVRAGATVEEVEQIIRHAVYIKPWGHGLPVGVKPTLRGMSELGG
ncbi:GTP 3',8-cyclase MoaA [Chloroflexus sp. MS-CIW-1]|jgi:cyclic pyranopterin phosphate synthase|uniref:GTP 3',8-cyclase MoaA n=1 Tax=unclassified Chloroflexus TaxID=2633855 RepID=UPI0004DEFFFE|nr:MULTISPECIES: GTP 3',8-cyclase MoaA [unclassified Chloroflexus]MBO9347738.1 GTP 3',8-cyclase MoaA [Chloroflexus sp.]MDN5271090.1 GTP 3',8-cyclase MoaA [Chloroflexus sp. MS-CIW-1]